MTASADSHDALGGFVRRSEFFVGIDSDGCAFDTMEVKHKECFIPPFIKHFRLAAVAKYARETCEFVNLYSKDRGANRFVAYLKALDLLAQRPEVARRGVSIPRVEGLRAWVARESKLGNPALKAEAEATGNADLKRTLAWSEEVNRNVAEIVQEVPPFPLVRESLQRLQGVADVMVVSATPGEALEREWTEHGLKPLVSLIAGQELGTKQEHLKRAAVGKYPADRILMVGDAPGDRRAAEAHGALFYPILPGREEESWQRFYDEAIDRFLAGRYAGSYADRLIAEFESLLPERPSWSAAG
ncbi:MAG: phosphatase [Isosphaeraceae bacterium]|jgi:phosphoglycolate phosphatase-like HAD superfamily hydrolase|nr:MAG: phosphatase [Isosphaeraceae bacterium]